MAITQEQLAQLLQDPVALEQIITQLSLTTTAPPTGQLPPFYPT